MTKETSIKYSISLEDCLPIQRCIVLSSWWGAWWDTGRYGAEEVAERYNLIHRHVYMCVWGEGRPWA